MSLAHPPKPRWDPNLRRWVTGLPQPTGDNPLFVRPALLTHPNIPVPLHGVNPRTVLGSGWWNAARKIVYGENNFCCWACGNHKTRAPLQRLEAHETYDVDYGRGRAVFVEVVALCHFCHQYIHSGRMRKLAESGQVDRDKVLRVRDHGYRILHSAGLEPSPWTRMNLEKGYTPSYEFLHGPFADWSDWRMVIGDKEYPPRFRNEVEYHAYYSQRRSTG